MLERLDCILAPKSEYLDGFLHHLAPEKEISEGNLPVEIETLFISISSSSPAHFSNASDKLFFVRRVDVG